MKQSFGKSTGIGSTHSNPIKLALFFAFALICIVVVYRAGQSNADTRSRASGDCMGKWRSAGKQRICKDVKNKKGVVREVCGMEMQYWCDTSAGNNTGNGGGTLQAIDGSGGGSKVITPTNPPTLQEAP